MKPQIPAYCSETAYSFPKEQSSDIIRTTSYHRKDYDLAVIWFPLSDHVVVTHPICFTFDKASATIGHLEKLPMELKHLVMSQLDISSLFCFRRTNNAARRLVDSMPQYRAMCTHAPNAYRALLHTRLASRVTMTDFYQLLCGEKCNFCSSFGNLVHLPTWIRCCSTCLEMRSLELRVTALAIVKDLFRLSKSSIASLPKFKPLPGVYSLSKHCVQRRMCKWLVPAESVVSAYKAENLGAELTPAMLDALYLGDILWDFTAYCSIPSYNPRMNQVDAGVSCAGCQVAAETHTSMSNSQRLRVLEGRSMVYSKTSFLRHFTWCKEAQNLWISSEGGTKRPLNYPKGCIYGASLNPRDL